MRKIFILMLFSWAVICSAFQVDVFGPEADDFNCANLDQEPASFGIRIDDQDKLCLWENGEWNSYSYYVNGLPVRSTCMLNADTMLVAMGAMTYSDGIYNFDIHTHTWQLNDWFLLPNFVKYNPNSQLYYVGERDGLYRSTNGHNWSRINSLGLNECSSLAWYGNNIITNNGQIVYYTNDNGLNWHQSSISNLHSFRFDDNGILYAIMDVTSDSDGLWRSNDFGANWVNILYTSALVCIGPVFNNNVTLGWRECYEDSSYVGMFRSNGTVSHFNHPSLNKPVKQMDIFPYINTPSFYVLNSDGCFYLTDFLVGIEDPVIPPIPIAKISAYPNPATAYANIAIYKNSPEPAELNIYNLKGQLVRSIEISRITKESTLNWDLNSFNSTKVAAGIYLLVLRDKAGKPLASNKLAVVK
jgi:hypothetical protein